MPTQKLSYAQPRTLLSDPVLRGLQLVIDLVDDLLEIESGVYNRTALLELRKRATQLVYVDNSRAS